MLTLGEDTYITLDDATAYFNQRLHASAWTAASDADRENALRTATMLLDLCDFRGQRTNASQLLAWPRSYVIGREGCIEPANLLPTAIKNATCEMAIDVLRRDPANGNARESITRRVVGDLQVEFSASQADSLPTLVRRLLSHYLLDGANTARLIP